LGKIQAEKYVNYEIQNWIIHHFTSIKIILLINRPVYLQGLPLNYRHSILLPIAIYCWIHQISFSISLFCVNYPWIGEGLDDTTVGRWEWLLGDRNRLGSSIARRSGQVIVWVLRWNCSCINQTKNKSCYKTDLLQRQK